MVASSGPLITPDLQFLRRVQESVQGLSGMRLTFLGPELEVLAEGGMEKLCSMVVASELGRQRCKIEHDDHLASVLNSRSWRPQKYVCHCKMLLVASPTSMGSRRVGFVACSGMLGSPLQSPEIEDLVAYISRMGASPELVRQAIVALPVVGQRELDHALSLAGVCMVKAHADAGFSSSRARERKAAGKSAAEVQPREREVSVDAIDLADRLGESMHEEFGPAATLGTGRPYSDFEIVVQPYHEACAAAEYWFHVGKNQTLFINDLQARDRRLENYPFDEEMQLWNKIRVGNRQDALQLVKQWWARMALSSAGDLDALKGLVSGLAALACRAAIDGGNDSPATFRWLLASIQEMQLCPNAESLRTFTFEKIGQLTEEVWLRYSAHQPGYIREATEFIERNFTQQLTLKDVAGFVHVSPSYFSRVFKVCVGETFQDYVTRLRVEEAKRLLKDRIPVAEVASMVGYTDPYYFSRVFRQTEGVPPSIYQAPE